MLEGLGSTQRGIEQERLDRQYNQQYATRMAPTQAASYIQGFAPTYQSGQTQVDKTYGLPVDPRNAALAAGLGVYNTFRPQQQQYQTNPADQAKADYYRSLITNQQGAAGTSVPAGTAVPPATYGSPLPGQGYAPPGTDSNYYNKFGVGP